MIFHREGVMVFLDNRPPIISPLPRDCVTLTFYHQTFFLPLLKGEKGRMRGYNKNNMVNTFY
jgi:hypothetical protein